MSIVLDIRQILDEGVVENERIEYKAGWNPESILHTVCAFANDFENTYGGYIIVGISEESGRPRDVVGIDKDSVDRLNKELFRLCNLIDPRYLADSEYSEYNGRGVYIIKAYGGRDRPYKCPVSLSEKKSEKAYYIRKNGVTVRANSYEEKELFRISDNTPFDDRINYDADINDLSYGMICDYLRSTGSRLLEGIENKTSKSLAEDIRIVSGPREERHPVNVGLMFFNEHPEDYFKQARIEIVYKPDATGKGMEEHVSTGPIDKQLKDALSFINRYVSEYVTKTDDRPDAVREYNYPMAAVEEALSNAVYHKGYDTPEPITVTILPDRMEITSCPGPDASITDSDLERCHLVSRTYRNRRIGEFLKELHLVEGRNTGVPLMMRSMRDNGSNPPIFQTDERRSYMTVILPVNRHFLPKADVNATSTNNGRMSDEQIAARLVALLRENGEMSVREISDALGYRSPPSSLRKVIRILIAAEAIQYTHPESPNAPNQKLVIW